MNFEVLYRPPNGGFVVGAAVHRIVDDILQRDETFWGRGNCHGAIYLGRELSSAPALVIVYKNGYGYHFQLTETVAASGDTYICVGSDNFADVVSLWVGQNDIRLPRAFFIDRAPAAQVVENFCRTGSRAPEVNWVRKRDTNWDFSGPESDEDDD